MRGRGRTIAGLSVALGLLTVALAGFFFKDSIREAWHIHKLETGYAEEKVAAAERLGELRSFRTAPSIRSTPLRDSQTSSARVGSASAYSRDTSPRRPARARC